MALPIAPGPFQPTDPFLRRVDRRKWLTKNGVVAAGAFLPREGETSISFTFQDENLRLPPSLDTYWRANRLPSGDLPGLCTLTQHDLAEELESPLPPRHQPDPEDTVYGHLHCVTDCPTATQAEQMALLATRNGVLRDLQRRA